MSSSRDPSQRPSPGLLQCLRLPDRIGLIRLAPQGSLVLKWNRLPQGLAYEASIVRKPRELPFLPNVFKQPLRRTGLGPLSWYSQLRRPSGARHGQSYLILFVALRRIFELFLDSVLCLRNNLKLFAQT